MPRRISAATPILPGRGRPPPPSDLSERERQIWNDVVESRPLNFFDAGTLALLAAYCMHAIQARDLAAELRLRATDKLRKAYRQETSMLATLSSKLRLAKLQSGRRKHQHSDAEEIEKTPKRRLWLVS
jgi:hypothetical protein